jgi:hypothetical protein
MELTSGAGTGPTTTVSTSHRRSEGGGLANAKAATRKAEASGQAGRGALVDASVGAGGVMLVQEGVGGVLERRHADGKPNDLRNRGTSSSPGVAANAGGSSLARGRVIPSRHVGDGRLSQQIGGLLRQQRDENRMRDGGKPGLGELGSDGREAPRLGVSFHAPSTQPGDWRQQAMVLAGLVIRLAVSTPPPIGSLQLPACLVSSSGA